MMTPAQVELLLAEKTRLAHIDDLSPAQIEELREVNHRIKTEPVGSCDECSEHTYIDSIRPWACSMSCYGESMGITGPDY